MNNEKGPLSWLKKLLSNEGQPEKKAGKYHYMLLVLCLGATFMLVGNMLLKNQPSASVVPAIKSVDTKAEDVPAFGMKKSSINNEMENYEQAYEGQMKDALESMLGVNDVKVVVNIDSSDIKIFEKNKVLKNQTTNETDRDGGKRQVEDSSVDEQLVIIRNGDKEVPIVVQTQKPKIRGVLVVAKGAEDIHVKKSIIEAVTRALDVPSFRVSVMPKK
ncbi:MAG: stage III sporulation protein AG [Bacillota bacterium]|nr:stage III sporulation protein AG [Bacillota bacterium]MDP4169126.1 stage III sporulation protein AG [Bacillota bacterium]